MAVVDEMPKFVSDSGGEFIVVQQVHKSARHVNTSIGPSMGADVGRVQYLNSRSTVDFGVKPREGTLGTRLMQVCQQTATLFHPNALLHS
jgi:hypothetical protein